MKNFHARPISLEFVKLKSIFFFFNYKMYLNTFHGISQTPLFESLLKICIVKYDYFLLLNLIYKT